MNFDSNVNGSISSSNEKSSKIGKIVKLFLEFIVAAVTAWLTASCVSMM